jgi:thiol:disulfide interchange protein DsbD
MIPILSSIIVGSGRDGHGVSHARGFSLSLAYVLGMAVTYAAAGVAAGLTGTLLAATLQNGWVLGGFAAVFIALSLSMFGFYELQLPTFLQSRVSEEASHIRGGSLPGVAAMGALSAIIVGPCVAAPLAGALLYISQSGDAVLGGAALFVMGLGMGAPLLAVGLRPGPCCRDRGHGWRRSRRLSASSCWRPPSGWFRRCCRVFVQMLAWALLLILPAIYLHALDPLPPHARGWQRFWKGIGIVMLLCGAAMLLGTLAGSRDPLQPLSVLRSGAANSEARSLPFTRVRSLADLEDRIRRQAGRSCSISMPTGAFHARKWSVSPSPMPGAGQSGRLDLLQADVTANSADDQALLQRFRLYGPPAILFFDHRWQGDRRAYASIGFQSADEFLSLLARLG